MFQECLDKIRVLLSDKAASPHIMLKTMAGGTFAAGTQVNVRVSTVTEFGETIPCQRVSVTTTADNQAVEVTIERVLAATGYRLYASVGQQTETLQAIVHTTQDAFVKFLLTEVGTGSEMPTVDTGYQYLSRGAVETSLIQAVFEYSNLYPRVVTKDISVVSGKRKYALPSEYIPNFSVVRSVEYPVDKIPPEFLDKTQYCIDDTYNLVFLDDELVLTDKFRLVLTTHHYLNNSGTSIPDGHIEGVVCLAASAACDFLATKYAYDVMPYASAGVVDFVGRSGHFRELAMQYRRQAMRIFGCEHELAPSVAYKSRIAEASSAIKSDVSG